MSLKVAIITGASSGLGLHTAKALFKTGNYKLVLACRSEPKTKSAIEEIVKTCPEQNADLLKFMKLDLTNRKSIFEFVSEFKSNFEGLDLLINNAGIMNHPHQLTEDNLEIHFATNYFGHWVLTKELLNSCNRNARIIIVTSGLYKNCKEMPSVNELTKEETIKTFKPSMLYSVSKLANCLQTVYLDEYLKSQTDEKLKTIKVFAIRPGFVRGTELGRHFHWFLRALSAPLIWMVAKNLDQGISGILHCSTSDAEHLKSGRLYFGDADEDYETSVSIEKAKELNQETENLLKSMDQASGDH
uniref:Short-chain dehydrogenase n=1 Tax=Panagrolaimus sp. JU765 TaxID=591449 RepID=A0AC34QRG3_9BILA